MAMAAGYALKLLVMIISFIVGRVNMTVSQKKSFVAFIEALSETGLAPITAKKASEKILKELRAKKISSTEAKK